MKIDELSIEELHKAHLAYMRFVRQMNKDRIKDYNKRYYFKKSLNKSDDNIKKSLTKPNQEIKKSLTKPNQEIKKSLTNTPEPKAKGSHSEQTNNQKEVLNIW